jgi:hypothetical protein
MRQRLVAILTFPLRALRFLLRQLARPFRVLGRLLKRVGRIGTPFKKLAGLKGKPRIAAIVILGAVVVVAVLALRPGPNEEKNVRATLTRYAEATRAKDYQTLCDDLFAKTIVAGLTNADLPCEVALKLSSLETVRNPQLTVLAVEVSGDQALARTRTTAVGETASLDTIKLVKEGGGWRIASLSEPGTQTTPAAGP